MCQKCDANVGASTTNLSQRGEAFEQQQFQSGEASATFSSQGGEASVTGSSQGGVVSDSVQGTTPVPHSSSVANQKRLLEIQDEKRQLHRRLKALRGEESEVLAVMEDGAAPKEESSDGVTNASDSQAEKREQQRASSNITEAQAFELLDRAEEKVWTLQSVCPQLSGRKFGEAIGKVRCS